MNRVGIFTISIDVELAWGMCDRPIHPHTWYRFELEREIIQRVLSMFSHFNISATWAVVGHLLLTECAWDGQMPHPEISRPVINNPKRDWFFQHPKSNDDPLWYGRDIIDWIRKASPPQEIGSHSFAHIPYHEKSTNRNTVKSDIERAKLLHEAANLPFDVFIFPRNIVGFTDLLAIAGIRIYRGHTKRWYNLVPGPLQRLMMLIDYVMGREPPTVMPVVDSYRMVDIPDSMLLLGRNGLRRLASSKSLVRMGIAGLNRAVREREVFHLWFHPSNFAYRADEQFQILEAILRHAQRLTKEGILEILTMRQIGQRTLDRSELA